MHNLNLIFVLQHPADPVTTTHNFPIHFNRNARGRQIEFCD